MVMTPKRNSCRNTPLILGVVFSLCTLHPHLKAREIEGICWIEVSLGKISVGEEIFHVKKSAVMHMLNHEYCSYRSPRNILQQELD